MSKDFDWIETKTELDKAREIYKEHFANKVKVVNGLSIASMLLLKVLDNIKDIKLKRQIALQVVTSLMVTIDVSGSMSREDVRKFLVSEGVPLDELL